MSINTFKLTAKSTGNVNVIFEFSDGPLALTPTEFCLSNRLGSPRLYINSVRRGLLEIDVFEEDVVEIENKRYVVFYKNGFILRDAGGTTYPISLLFNNEYKVVGMFDTVQEFKASMRQQTSKRTLYKANDIYFILTDVLAVNDNGVLTVHNSNYIPLSTVHQDCRTVVNNHKLFLGEKYLGGTVVLHQGELLLQYGDCLKEIGG